MMNMRLKIFTWGTCRSCLITYLWKQAMKVFGKASQLLIFFFSGNFLFKWKKLWKQNVNQAYWGCWLVEFQ